MDLSNENHPTMIKTTNVQGGQAEMVKFGGERRQTRRALSLINQNLITAHRHPCVVNKRGLTEKFVAAQIGSSHRHGLEENKKPKIAAEGFKVWEEHEGCKYQPMPMCLEPSETLSGDQTEMEVEMEDIFEEALIDIDSDDANYPFAVVDYVGDIYANYRKMEVYSCVSPSYMEQQLDITGRIRAILVDWLIEVHHKFELKEETLFLTVNLIDRFLEKQTVEKKKLQLVGLVAMLLASKYEEISVPVVDDLLIISANTYTRKDVLEMESLMLNKLKFNISVPTPYVFMRRFLKAAQADKKLEVLSFLLIELCLVEYEMLKHPPSFMAAAAIYTAQCTLYGVKQWSKTCEWHTSYSEDPLLECSRSIVSYHQKAATGKLTGVHTKYSSSKFGYAAKLEPAHFLVQTQ
ncbi:G2/mitotic-specific cyclin-2-like isoform X2 [Lycium ferocissimum]|uniref:G2/mitotic-specific cyclin-2-like isoform X2 n=1 Tax=Lycium ferocissimum TaxID=112874 RepID=UPI0028159F6E|nr:G2/mitotic-specific cyclin-2-like isoform X2 [Lycium ferocissimum]